MKFNQIYTVINTVAAQMGGAESSVVDTSSFVTFGDRVLASDDAKEAFTKELANLISRVVSVSKTYTPDIVDIIKDPITFGAAIEMVYGDMPDAKTADTYDNYENGDELHEFIVAKPTVHSRIFSKAAAFDIALTVPDKMLQTAFLNEQEMGSFIGMLFTNVNNAVAMRLEGSAMMARNTLIAASLDNNKAGAKTAINLLSLYNDKFNDTLTADECIYDAHFLRFASREIKMTIKRMGKPNTAYNLEGYKNWSTQDALSINVLSEFAENAKYYLESDIYHADLVKLPSYREVLFWQTNSNDFADASSINLEYMPTSGTSKKSVNQSGIIGVVYDNFAIGTTMYDPRTKSSYSARYELTNYYHKADVAYYVNGFENAVVFYVADNVNG